MLSRYLENGQFWYFEDQKRSLFTPLYEISLFSLFSNFVHFAWGGGQKVFISAIHKCPFFVVLTKNLPKHMYHTTQALNFQFEVCLTSWPWMTWALNVTNEGLGWYLKVSQTQSVLFYWLISLWYGCSARRFQIITPSRQHFDFTRPVTSSVTRYSSIGFPSINFAGLSNTVWIS